MDGSYEVVIVGGGVVGCAIAYFLTANPDFQGRVAVVERDPTYTASSSSLSASSIRQQFGTPPNIHKSASSIRFLREVRARLSVEDNVADIGLREPGYLILGAPDKRAAFEARHEVQRGEDVPVALLTPEALAARFPELNVDGVGVGSLGEADEGWFDGPGLHQAYRRRARAQGAVFVNGAVAGFEKAGPRIAAVLLEDGTRLACGTAVNAAGAWSGAVARMAGVEVPVVPRKRCIFVVDTPAKLPGGHFLHDTSGAYIRPEGHLYLCGNTPDVENDVDDFSLEVDHALFDDMIWPALAHRVPGLERLRLLRSWAGHYDYNVFDHSAIIGPLPDIPNFVMANGFSGHGMMHSPATGMGVSEWITYGEYRTLDLSAFRFERIAANQAIPEHVY